MFPSLRQKEDYSPISSDGETPHDSLLEHARSRSKKRRVNVTALNGIIFLASLLCLIVSAALTWSRSSEDLLQRLAFYTTVKLESKPEPHHYRTHKLWHKESIYRQPPSPEVDAAWNAISEAILIPISKAEVSRLGKDPYATIHTPASWGYPPGTHVAGIDSDHLLHCLNTLRKSLHFNFAHYHKGPLKPSYHAHTSHCLDALRHHLMCKPSVELITWTWVQGYERPFADFDLNKKCWNYDELRAWQAKNRIPVERTEDGQWVGVTPWPEEMRMPMPILVQEGNNLTGSGET